MHSVMRTQAISFDSFYDQNPTTLDPSYDMDAQAEFDEDEHTPATLDPCPECGRGLTRLADWIPQPATPEAAWRGWIRSCVATQSSSWQWCPLTGWLTARVRVQWPRKVGLPGPVNPFPAFQMSAVRPLPQAATSAPGGT